MRRRIWSIDVVSVAVSMATFAMFTISCATLGAQDASAEKPTPGQHDASSEHDSAVSADLAKEIRRLQNSIAALEAALKRDHEMTATTTQRAMDRSNTGIASAQTANNRKGSAQAMGGMSKMGDMKMMPPMGGMSNQSTSDPAINGMA